MAETTEATAAATASNTNGLEELRIAHAKEFADLLAKHPPTGSDLTHTNFFCWRSTIPTFVARVTPSDGAKDGRQSLVVMTENRRGGLVVLGDVIGTAHVKDVVEQFPRVEAFLRINAATAKQIEEELHVPAVRDRDQDDYVYNVSDLATLPGAKFIKKRQLVSRAEKAFPDAELCRMETPEHIRECADLLRRWCKAKGLPLSSDMCSEVMATCQALSHWEELSKSVFGFMLRIHGRVEAFAVMEQLAPGVAVCHFEKSNHELVGVSQLLVKLVAERGLASFKYENREQDLGSPGLRKAKESYHPVMMVEKYRARIVPKASPSTVGESSGDDDAVFQIRKKEITELPHLARVLADSPTSSCSVCGKAVTR